jgi:hypothetical protein
VTAAPRTDEQEIALRQARAQPRNAFLPKCGKASFDSVKGDQTGHIEEQEPISAGCELTLCRGMVRARAHANSRRR